MKIILVDDSAVILERLRDLLADIPEGEVVGEATNALDAIVLIQDRSPDVVILDIQLSTGTGLEVLRQAKPMLPATVFIMLTNYASAPYRVACMKAGADLFFDKSFEFDRVRDAVATTQRARHAPSDGPSPAENVSSSLPMSSPMFAMCRE